MELTPRERFTRCAFGQDVDMLPIQCDFTGSKLKDFLTAKGIDNISDLELLKFFDNHVLYAYMNGATLQMKTKNFGGADYATDEWGCKWDAKQDLFYMNNPLENWEDFERYQLPDPWAPGYLDYAEMVTAKYAHERIVTGYHFCALFERAYILRGFENVLADFYEEEERLTALLDKITAFQVELAKRYIGIGVNCGRTVDDYGTQTSLIISPPMWRKFIKPRLAQIIAVYRNAGLPVIHHSCGNIMSIVGDLAEIGVNVLNPIQPNAMDLTALADGYGDKLAFFGGICNQHVLPHQTPEEIDASVKATVDILGKNGRYIIAPSNSIGRDVPEENVEAFYRAAQKYRRIHG